MIVELGHFALILAFATSLVQATLPIIGSRRRDSWGAPGVLLSLGFGFLLVSTWRRKDRPLGKSLTPGEEMHLNRILDH